MLASAPDCSPDQITAVRVSRRLTRRTAAWLVDAVAPGRAPRTWDGDALDVPADIALAAQVHGVEGWVRRRAQTTGVEVPEVDEAVQGALARHLRALSDLGLVQGSFTRAGIPFLVVKGPALVERLYGSADLRSYVDLDLLVRPSDLGAAVRALEEDGCEVLDANWPLLQRARVLELRLLSPTGGAIDLHWSLAKGPGPNDSSPSVDTLLTRAETWSLKEMSALTLGWADTAVHLAVHAAGSGGHRLLWCADLRAALEGMPAPGAADLVQCAAEWRAGPQVHLMLLRTRSALGTPVPQDVLRGLGVHPSWTTLTRMVDRALPVERHGEGRGLTRLLARSASTTSRTSWAALGHKTFQAAKAPNGQVSPDWLLDPDEPRSALHPVGGAEGREAFLASVAEGGREAGR